MNNAKVLQLDFGFNSEPIINQKSPPKSNRIISSDFVFDFMDCLSSPIIVFKSAWQDTIPVDLKKNVTMARMLCLMTGEQMASLTEVVAYMMPRTLESPMPSEWVNIYTWAGLQYAKSFNDLDQQKQMEEIAPENLSDYERHLLNDLRKWIYEKRRDALKKSLKSKKQANLNNIATKQKSFFDH